jgi:hypothetical protein
MRWCEVVCGGVRWCAVRLPIEGCHGVQPVQGSIGEVLRQQVDDDHAGAASMVVQD